jgi:DNA-binding SARP family transcriptional activator/tetratricopeptide (TPR) repeat protein
MLRLQTLGGLALERDGTPLIGAAPRRRLLALLALVAGHGTHGLTRDKLLAYLWPESDTSRARNSLKQALFSLRQTLDPEAIATYGGSVRLDPTAIEVDVWEFEDALDRGHPAEAVAVYRGAFLDGFFVEGLGELEAWAESERRRLSRRRTDALQRLAERTAATGDLLASVHWWRLVAAAEPLGSTGVLGLMRALVAAGDRAGALEHYRLYETTIQVELGVPADEPVRELAERLRCLRASVTPPPTLPVAAAATASPAAAPTFRPPPLVAAFGAASAAVVPVPVNRTMTPGVAAYVGPLLVVLGLAGGVRLFPPARASGTAVENPARLTVLPFESLGDPQTRDLGRGFDALLASGLDGLEEFRVVPATPARGQTRPWTPSAASDLARRAGARLYVTGRLVADHGRLRATASLRDRANANREVGRAEAEAGSGELFALADEIVRGLVADRHRAPGERLARSAATSTRSLPALKAYLEGERELRADRHPAAADAFYRAVRADTAFALAYYRLSVAADRAGEAEKALWAAGLAARFSDRLSEHDRRLVTAFLTAQRGGLDEAERLYRRILADYPEDVEAWLQLGELLLHGNPLRGRSATEARSPFERVLALDPGEGDALVHLARIAAIEGRPLEVDTLLQRAAAATNGVAALDLRAVRAFALNDRPRRERATRELLSQPSLVPRRLVLEVAVHLDDLAGSARFAQLLTAAPGTCDVPALGHRMLAQVALARGQIQRADDQLEQAFPCDPAAAAELATLMAVQPFLNRPDSELAALRRRLHPAAGVEMDPALRTYYSALIEIRLGNTIAGARAVRLLRQTRDSTGAGDLARSLAHSLRARIHLANHRTAAALAELEGAGWERTAGLSVAEASDRFLRAELLRVLGRREEAIGWYSSIAQRASYELVYLAPAELRLARIYESQGNPTAARAHFSRFVDLWRHADPELQPAVVEAERRIAVLADRTAAGE